MGGSVESRQEAINDDGGCFESHQGGWQEASSHQGRWQGEERVALLRLGSHFGNERRSALSCLNFSLRPALLLFGALQCKETADFGQCGYQS
jgi:hypothetical protein